MLYKPFDFKTSTQQLRESIYLAAALILEKNINRADLSKPEMRRQKSKKTSQIILVVLIAFIMITSVIGFIWSGAQKIRYNKFSFEQKETGFATTINDKEVFFSYLPQDVENIKIDAEIIARLAKTPQIDTTSDFNDTNNDAIALVQYNLNQVLDPFFTIYLRQGFNTNNTYNRPVITCENAKKVPVLYFKTSDKNNISYTDSCILIESQEAVDFIKIKDRLLYSLLGVIK